MSNFDMINLLWNRGELDANAADLTTKFFEVGTLAAYSFTYS
jgi:hypothetical protein